MCTTTEEITRGSCSAGAKSYFLISVLTTAEPKAPGGPSRNLDACCCPVHANDVCAKARDGRNLRITGPRKLKARTVLSAFSGHRCLGDRGHRRPVAGIFLLSFRLFRGKVLISTKSRCSPIVSQRLAFGRLLHILQRRAHQLLHCPCKWPTCMLRIPAFSTLLPVPSSISSSTGPSSTTTCYVKLDEQLAPRRFNITTHWYGAPTLKPVIILVRTLPAVIALQGPIAQRLQR